MAAGRKPAKVTYAPVQGQQHPVRSRGCSDHGFVSGATKPLIEHGVDVESSSSKLVGQVPGKVLVELELHACNGWTSSRANAAP